jgi:uncharacterized membrane protein YcjF (UPF0283 family)
MSDPDIRLKAALHADPPPARDAKFRVEVLLRIERARFKRRVVMTLAVSFAAAALVAVNAQTLEAWIATDIWRLGIVAVAAVILMLSLSGVPIAALCGFRGFARTLGRWLYP